MSIDHCCLQKIEIKGSYVHADQKCVSVVRFCNCIHSHYQSFLFLYDIRIKYPPPSIFPLSLVTVFSYVRHPFQNAWFKFITLMKKFIIFCHLVSCVSAATYHTESQNWVEDKQVHNIQVEPSFWQLWPFKQGKGNCNMVLVLMQIHPHTIQFYYQFVNIFLSVPFIFFLIWKVQQLH